MASDITLDENKITLSEAEKIVAEYEGRSIEVDLRPNASVTIGSDEHRGQLRLAGDNARVFVTNGAVQARDLVAREDVRIGRRGEGGTSPGHLTIQSADRDLLLDVDGSQGTITIDGFGDLRDRLAELRDLRQTVARLESRLAAVERR